MSIPIKNAATYYITSLRLTFGTDHAYYLQYKSTLKMGLIGAKLPIRGRVKIYGWSTLC